MVDAGNFGGSMTPAQKLKVEFVLRGMSALEYDAINLAENELQYGIGYLDRLQSEYNLPLVSANVYTATSNEHYARSFRVLDKNGLKIAVFGLVSELRGRRTVKPETGFVIRDPYEEGRKVLSRLRGSYDVIVGLLSLGLAESQRFAAEIPGCDFIISGGSWEVSDAPVKIGDTVIMQTGTQGKYLGHLQFKVANGKPTVVSGTVHPLDEQIDDDARMKSIVDEYDEALLTAFPLETEKATEAFTYYSEKSCAICHRAERQQWQSTLHAKAWQTLVEKGEAHNPECQACHTTMYGEPNGFSVLHDTPFLVDVQCAECHRLAGDNMEMHLQRHQFQPAPDSPAAKKENLAKDFKPVTENLCKKCHNAENTPKWDFDVFLPKVSH